MKKVALFIIGFGSIIAYAQKTKPVLQNTFVTTIVNEGTKNHFTDKVNACDLTFTIDAEAKLNGPITIKNATTSAVIFQGTMKDNYLVDSAMWFENNKLVKVANFKEKCCTSPTNYVDPTAKVLSSIKGERHGAERIFHSNAALKEVNHYQAGKRQGKQYIYNTNKTLIAIRTYKDDKLNDTSWINCDHKVPDIEIYTAGVPSGVWKKFNATGVQTEAKYILPGVDSTIFYTADKKPATILCKSTAEGNFHSIREYDAKLSLTKQYTLRDRTDSIGEWLDGTYQEFVGGKLIVNGEYSFGEKVETWTTFDKKGKEIKSETFKIRDEVIALHPETTATTTAVAAAVDLFPPSLTKATISMVFESNGKVEKIFKKVQEIKWALDVKSNTDYKVVCTDEALTEGERADVVSYLASCITTVKGVRYSHKEVSFVSQYKLEFK